MTVKLLCRIRMMMVVPMIIYQGLSISYGISVILRLLIKFDKSPDDLEKDLYSMSSIGIGAIIGGYVVGIVKDLSGNLSAVGICLICTSISTLFIYWFEFESFESNTFQRSLLCFFWALQTAACHNLMSCIIMF